MPTDTNAIALPSLRWKEGELLIGKQSLGRVSPPPEWDTEGRWTAYGLYTDFTILDTTCADESDARTKVMAYARTLLGSPAPAPVVVRVHFANGGVGSFPCGAAWDALADVDASKVTCPGCLKYDLKCEDPECEFDHDSRGTHRPAVGETATVEPDWARGLSRAELIARVEQARKDGAKEQRDRVDSYLSKARVPLNDVERAREVIREAIDIDARVEGAKREERERLHSLPDRARMIVERRSPQSVTLIADLREELDATSAEERPEPKPGVRAGWPICSRHPDGRHRQVRFINGLFNFCLAESCGWSCPLVSDAPPAPHICLHGVSLDRWCKHCPDNGRTRTPIQPVNSCNWADCLDDAADMENNAILESAPEPAPKEADPPAPKVEPMRHLPTTDGKPACRYSGEAMYGTRPQGCHECEFQWDAHHTAKAAAK